LISNKKRNGVVYTPSNIVKIILDEVGYTPCGDKDKRKIIDPSCGDGAFLKEIVELLSVECPQASAEELVWGIDIDQKAIAECKHNLNLIREKYSLTRLKWKNVICGNTFDKREEFHQKFDFVVGNPPYVRIQNLGESQRKFLQSNYLFCRDGSADLYMAFMELGYDLIAVDGKLGFITPNSYIKNNCGKEIRKFLKETKSIKMLVDFDAEKIFKGISTYTAIIVLVKQSMVEKFVLKSYQAGSLLRVGDIYFNDLGEEAWVLKDKKTLKRISEIKKRGVPLGKIARISVGLATLSDKYFIFSDPVFGEGIANIDVPCIGLVQIEQSILRPIIKASTWKARRQKQNKWILFPYEDGKIIPEKKLIKKYPKAYQYLKSVKTKLDERDAGKKNPIAWYAFGRSQGIISSFGKKIITSTMNQKPNFIVCDDSNYTFYAGYAIFSEGNLEDLAAQLNSDDMEFFINNTSKPYSGGYRSYSKSFIKEFGVEKLK